MNITELEKARIEVKYRNGACLAGSNLSAGQASQVLRAIQPKAILIFGAKGLSLEGYSGRYVIMSNNGREMSGHANTPKEALGMSWTVLASLEHYIKNQGGK